MARKVGPVSYDNTVFEDQVCADPVTHLEASGVTEVPEQISTEQRSQSQHTRSLRELPVSKRVLLSVLIPFVFVVFLCYRLMVTFYPKEAELRQIDSLTVGWVFSSQSIFAIIPMLTVGAMISYFGAFKVMLTSSAIAATANILFGLISFISLSPVFVGLSFLLRGIQGLALSCMDPAILVIINQEFKPIYTTIIGIVEGAVGMAILCSPILGAFLYQRSSFLVPFLTVGSLMILMFCLTLAIYRIQLEKGQLTAHSRDPLEGGFCTSCRELCKMIPRTLQQPRLFAATFGMFHVEMMESSLDPILEPYARNQFGIDEEGVGIWWLISSAFYIFLVPLTGFLIHRYQKHIDCLAVLSVGHLLGFLSMMLIAPSPILAFLTPDRWTTLSGLIILGLASALCFVPAATMLMSVAERHNVHGDAEKAASTGAVLFFLSGRISSVVCPIVSGALEPSIGFGWTLTAFAFVSLAMMIISTVTKLCTVNPGVHDKGS